MKLHLLCLLLLLVLLAGCSGTVAVTTLTPTLPPPLPATATTAPTATQPPPATPTLPATETPSPTLTEAPTATGTSTPTLIPVEMPTPDPACSAVFMPTGFTADGKGLVGRMDVMDNPGTRLQVLDLQTWQARTVFKSSDIISVAALSPDGGTVAWALPDFSVQLIRLRDGKVTATLSGHTQVVNALVFSPDGSRLYSASNDQSVIIWDTEKRAQERVFQPTFHADSSPSAVIGLGISPDGKTIITIPVDGTTRAWDTATFQQVGEYPGIIAGAYNPASARYSPDGQFFAIDLAGGPGNIDLWRSADQHKVWSGGMIAGFDFSPDSRLFAHTELDANGRTQVVIRPEDGQTVLRTIPPTSEGIVFDLHFSPDSKTLALVDMNYLRLWNVEDGSLLKTYAPPCPK